MNAPSFRVDGKVALITGSGRGIGLGMARALAASGASVVIQDIELPVAEEAAAEIRRNGGKAIALPGDMTDLGVCETLVAETVRQLGSIDILINNAAIQSHQSWFEIPLEQIRREFDADLIAPILLSRLAAAHMKTKKWGRILMLGSIQQRGANPHMLPYSLSKSAIEKLTRALARDLAKDNITVNCIAPGWVNTWRNRNDFTDEEDMKQKGKHVPLGRVGQPEDYGGVCLLLCSEAGNYITGQNIFVDGGMSAR